MPRTVRFEEIDSQRDALEKLEGLIRRGSVDPRIVAAARAITRDCPARDDLCELEALYDAVKSGTSRVSWLRRGMRYVADPHSFDTFSAVSAIIDDCEAGSCAGDCLPIETIVLRRDYRLVPLAEIRVGDVIWGDGRWTTVTNVWDKGVKDLLGLRLNNGSFFRVTEEHRLFRVPQVNVDGHSCPSAAQPGPRESAEEVRAGEIRPGNDLLTGTRIPFGQEELDSDLAWLLGVYIADGWSEELEGEPYRCSISGRDGKPKEAQKRRVQEIAEKHGWATRWHERYIAINNRETARWLAATGKRAPWKHVPSGLNFAENTVRAVLSGLVADACLREDGTVVYGTTSSLLALQLRVLHAMLGQSTSVRRVDDHGGLGSNPIYRVTPRKLPDARKDGKPHRVHARVKAIEECGSGPVMDIETDTGRFWLPESDLVVHNCDDHVVLIGSLAAAVGFKVGARAWGPGSSGDYQHVYAVALVPKNGPWPASGYYGHGLDTTVPSFGVGDEPPGGHVMTAWLTGD